MKPFRLIQGAILHIFGSRRLLVWNLLACLITSCSTQVKSGIREDALRNVTPVLNFHGKQNQTRHELSCNMCWATLEWTPGEAEYIEITDCKHRFHESCFKESINTCSNSPTCPTCGCIINDKNVLKKQQQIPDILDEPNNTGQRTSKQNQTCHKPSCSICSETLNEEYIKITDCEHRFHENCFKKSINTCSNSPTCPTCGCIINDKNVLKKQQQIPDILDEPNNTGQRTSKQNQTCHKPSCSICSETLNEEYIKITDCEHRFHENCFKKSIKPCIDLPTCPTCGCVIIDNKNLFKKQAS